MSNHDHKHFDHLKVERKEGEASITGELTLEYLSEVRPAALKHLNEHVTIAGFRKGAVPDSILVKNLGEMRILEETAEMALSHAYGDIIRESKLSPLGRPHIAVTKLAPGIPLEFKITVILEPEFSLPDYKKLISAIGKEEEKPDAPPTQAGKEEDKFWAREKRRAAIMEALVKATEIKVPDLLVEYELDKMVNQFRSDLESHGTKWEEYLKTIKKSEEDLKKEWREGALNRAKAELIIVKISEAEGLEPTPEDIEKETKHVLSHHPDADPLRARIYVYQYLRTQKVLEFLETL